MHHLHSLPIRASLEFEWQMSLGIQILLVLAFSLPLPPFTVLLSSPPSFSFSSFFSSLSYTCCFSNSDLLNIYVVWKAVCIEFTFLCSLLGFLTLCAAYMQIRERETQQHFQCVREECVEYGHVRKKKKTNFLIAPSNLIIGYL